jgi:hypothetical protein
MPSAEFTSSTQNASCLAVSPVTLSSVAISFLHVVGWQFIQPVVFGFGFLKEHARAPGLAAATKGALRTREGVRTLAACLAPVFLPFAVILHGVKDLLLPSKTPNKNGPPTGEPHLMISGYEMPMGTTSSQSINRIKSHSLHNCQNISE